ncbi:unnamed protein product [Amaranthus hypochondriacus]
MYQTMSPDNLASTITTTTSIRKSNPSSLKPIKEEKTQNIPENGRISNSTFEGNNNTNNPNGSIHKPQNQQEMQQASSSSAANEISPSLPQWGPWKRSRCSRTEGRSSMVNVVLEKHNNHVMVPPPHLRFSPGASTSGNGGKNGGSSRVRTHGLVHGKESSGFLGSKNRNQVDQTIATNNASPSRNGGGSSSSSRPISRSTIGKRSPSCINKAEKKTTITKVKSEDSVMANQLELVEGDQHEQCSGSMAAEKSREVIEWPRIYVSLSRKEKEDDFYAMKGTKLPHRPKKRPKAVDRALQYCFPGLWLADLTRARYEVRERKSAKKQPRRRGLKGLETMESDSE